MASRKRPGPFEDDSESDAALSSSQTSSVNKRRRANDGSSILSTPATDEEPQSPATTPQSDDDADSDADEDVETQDPPRYITAEDNEAVDSGVLQSIHVVNFMCHENERWELGPLINFICGKNGSGKSAILTAAQLCFGGKAAATGRGRKLEDYIRTGQTSASVTCTVKNEGAGAFRHEDYGDSISIERHWHLTASKNCVAGFKIRNTNGKVMASKKGDLEEIVEHFTLQFDNPLATLTQDEARSFIADSKPSEKYKLFLRGVMLEQLDQDYKLIEDQIDNYGPKLAQKEEDVKHCKAKKIAADRKLQESERHASRRERLHELKHQCIWVQVVEQEKARDGIANEIRQFDQSITEEEAKQEHCAREVERVERVHDEKKAEVDTAQARVNEMQSAQTEANEKAKEAKKATTEAKNELGNVKDTIAAAQREIEQKKQDIENEEARLAELHGGGAAERRRELEELKRSAEEAGLDVQRHRNERSSINTNAADAQTRLEEARQKHGEQHDEVKACKQKLSEVRKAGSTPDTKFHKQMPQLLQAINREKRFRERPIGPIGKHVTLLAPKFAYILEKVFGLTLGGFIVTDRADQELLMGLARKNGMPELKVNYVNPAPLNLSGKEPDESFMTILRALRIDNELVRKLLVIAHHAESSILIEDFTKAQDLMNRANPSERPAMVESCYSLAPGNAQRGFRFHYRGNNPAMDPVDAWNGPLRMNANVADQVRLQETRVQEAENILATYSEEVNECQAKLNDAKTALAQHKARDLELRTAKQTLDTQVEGKQGDVEQDEVEVGTLDSLKDSLKELEVKLARQGDLYGDAVTHSDTVKEEEKTARKEAAEATKQLATIQATADALKREMQHADSQKAAAVVAVNHSLNKLAAIKSDRENWERNLAVEEENLANLTRQAADLGSARVPVPDNETSDSLTRKFNSLKDQLNNAERNLGGSHLEIQERATEATEQYNSAMTQYQELEKLRTLFTSSLKTRHERWHLFRRYIGKSARSGFIHQLSNRAFRGKLIIDHNSHKLETKIEPDITQKDGNARSARTLSGGEKTYVQICLLLALWEAMGSPIRCLDEFDVFMDNINRGVVIGMIVEAARQSQGKQYVMISPGSRGDIKRAPDVHAFEVAPPERGQARLNFQRVSAAA